MSRLTVYGGGGGTSPLTAKGDLYGYTTQGARVPVGTDGQALVADSSQAVGVGYGWVYAPPPKIGRWFGNIHSFGDVYASGSLVQFQANANTLYLYPVLFPLRMTITKLAAMVKTATTGGNMRVGLFTINPDAGTAALLVDSGQFATTAAGWQYLTVAATAVPAGLCAFGVLADTAVQLQHFNPVRYLSVTDPSFNRPDSDDHWQKNSVPYGAFAASYSGLAITGANTIGSPDLYVLRSA